MSAMSIPVPNENTVFLPLQELTDEQYSSIRLRWMTNQWPTMVFDQGDYPCRTLSVWPVPTEQQGVELWLWEPLNTYGDLDAELNLPPGYERYLRYALAVELAAEFGKTVTPTVSAVAKEAEANVKKLNQQVPIGAHSDAYNTLNKQGRKWTYIDMIEGAGVKRSRR